MEREIVINNNGSRIVNPNEVGTLTQIVNEWGGDEKLIRKFQR